MASEQLLVSSGCLCQLCSLVHVYTRMLSSAASQQVIELRCCSFFCVPEEATIGVTINCACSGMLYGGHGF